jgi:glycerol-3-phosphate dehydrogenase
LPLSADELDEPLLGDLAPRHGPYARRLVEHIAGDPASGQRLLDDLPYRWAEIDHAIAYEGVVHLEDLMRRRIPLGLTDAELGVKVARTVAQRLVDAWGGSATDVKAELERYRQAMAVETGRVLARDC